MSFLPAGYETPRNTSFMKFQQGANKFRVVTNALIGFEYWNTDNKPVRLKELPKKNPADLKKNEDGTFSLIKHFWAFLVIDREDNSIKQLMITQASIMHAIEDLLTNPEWGDPQGYDLTVNRTGESLKTKYSVQPSPAKKLTKEEKALVMDSDLNLEKIVFGKKFNKVEEKEEVKEDNGDSKLTIEDIPF